MRALLAPLVTAAILLTGCGSTRPPAASVQAATLNTRSSDGLVLDFALLVDNGNAKPLPLRDVTYSVWLDGRPVFTGMRSAACTAAAFSQANLVLPASVSGAIGDGPVRYRITGTLAYDSPDVIAQTLAEAELKHPDVSFSHEGSVDLGTAAPMPTGPARHPPADAGRKR